MSYNVEFVEPEWLNGQDAETIHARMMSSLPEDIDNTEGGFPWDFTKPSALEKAELLEYTTMETLKLMHYMFSYGIYLDYHAIAAGISRKPANRASGSVTITGSPGTEIPIGFQFAVPATGDSPAIVFEATEEATIEYDGVAEISVQAVDAGLAGNVAADTIVIMVKPIEGITSITNEDRISGGVAEESDADLRERIRYLYETADISYAGCDADYRRWAKEVLGVGEAVVIAEWSGPGTVKVVLTDGNGQPANNQIINAVYDYIVSPSDRYRRKAPIGASVTVVAPTTVTVDISCEAALETGAERELVEADLIEKLNKYFDEARVEGQIRRNYVGSLIMSTNGISDYTDLTLNGEESNIEIEQDEYPVVGTLATEVL